MKPRQVISAGALTIVIVVGSPLVVPLASQAQKVAPTTYTPPKTPWGDPDLQGVYDFQTRLHLERPAEFAGRTTLTEEEFAKQRVQSSFQDGWNPESFVKDLRTALITDPPDGRIPLHEEGRKKFLAIEEYRRIHQLAYETWAEIGSYERCISRMSPRLLQGYNSGTQIFQSPGYVTIVHEQLDTRIIPLGERPHLDQDVRQWNGDSVGHWEGSTLVVEVTNFTDKQTGWPPMRHHDGPEDTLGHAGVPRGNSRMIERYTPVSATRLEYSVTTEDPTWFSRPWTLMIPWERQEDHQLYEYACSEGNLSTESALRAARFDEISGKPYQPREVLLGRVPNDPRYDEPVSFGEVKQE